MNVIFKNFDFKATAKKALSFLNNTKNLVLGFVTSSYSIIKDKLGNNKLFVNVFEFAKKNKTAIKITSFCLISIVSLLITAAASGLRIGFKVKYSGKVIATVKSTAVSKDAFGLALKYVNNDCASKEILLPKLSLTLTFSNDFNDASYLADAIIANTGKIAPASMLLVDGEEVLIYDTDKLNNLLENRRTAFYIEKAENKAEFVKKVEVKNGYFHFDELAKKTVVEEEISKLDVKTVSKCVTDISIPFTTEKVKTTTETYGYSKVTTVGKNGLTKQTQKIVLLNGEQTENEILSTEVITEPVTEVITIGVGTAYISATDKANITAAGFICPLPRGSFIISSYWGDGRNHKGLDLAANKGVPIFAAAKGTVTYSGYSGDYGYSVVIDHGNGLKTRYAHASALCVRVGDVVAQGDMIAAVGSTGYSTGDHLHFEVIVNGTRVNPAPYIGL